MSGYDYKWVDPYERSFREGSARIAREMESLKRMNENSAVETVAGVPFKRSYPAYNSNGTEYWRVQLPGVELTVEGKDDRWTFKYTDGESRENYNLVSKTREAAMHSCTDRVWTLAEKALRNRRADVAALERAIGQMNKPSWMRQ